MDEQKPVIDPDSIHVSCGTPFPSKTQTDGERTADDQEMIEGHRNDGAVQDEEQRRQDYGKWHPPQHEETKQ